MASCVAIISCTKEQTNEELPFVEDTKDGKITCVLPNTKTSLGEDLKVLWSDGDKVRVYSNIVLSGAEYVTTVGGASTGVFSPVSSKVEEETRFALYPASAGGVMNGGSASVSFAALASQTYTNALSSQTSISALPLVSKSTGDTFTFVNVCGGLSFQIVDYMQSGLKVKKIELTAKGGEAIAGQMSVNLETGVADLSSSTGNKSITVNCGEGVEVGGLSTESYPFIIFLPAGNYTNGLTFIITDTEGQTYTVSTNKAVTVSAGVVTPFAPLQLTRYYGKANCYSVAPVAGTTEIDITPYYTWSSAYTYDNITVGNPVGAVKAEVLWQICNSNDSGDVVGIPTISGNTLSVPVVGTRGNALVAIYDSADKIMWSYHVWVSEINDLPYSNATLGNYVMQDRNIGATSTTLKDQNTYGCFFQWGRKDAFPRPAHSDRPTGSPYNSEESVLYEKVESTAENGTISYSVRNPKTRLLAAQDWLFAERNNALWGNLNGTTTVGIGVKTVYDPCPEGYRVPEAMSFSAMEWQFNKAECDANYGYTFITDGGSTTTTYPTGGYVTKNEAFIKYLEYRGYHWTNVAGGTGAYYLLCNNASVKINGMDRAFGLPVRCQKEN